MSDAVRTAIVAILAAVPGIGVVHDRERYAKNAADLKALYVWDNPDTGKPELRGWAVSFVAERYGSARAGRSTVVTEWRLVGYVGFDDAGASEHVATELARAVVAAIGANPRLNGTVSRLSDSAAGADAPDGAQIRRLEPVMFAGALAHRATLSLVTERFQ